MSGIFDEIRAACARVAAEARFVTIDEAGFDAWVATLEERPQQGAAAPDPAHRSFEDPDTRLAYVVTLDALNFGSGWFPVLHKRDGRSGYFTIATHLAEHFTRAGPWSAVALRRIDAERCALVFGQQGNDEVRELMALFARSLNDLGEWLGGRHGGSFAKAIESAEGDAERLVARLAEMPLYRDVSRYRGFDVPLYKRAQLTVSDLETAFAGRGPGRFARTDQLTIFADNLVPHVLRCDGVLAYDPGLASRIDRYAPIAPGSPEEVEIRAVALHAVERAVAALRVAGVATSARELDTFLWNRGQRPEIKAHPRHRARCAYY